jgi:hypothetical protein
VRRIDPARGVAQQDGSDLPGTAQVPLTESGKRPGRRGRRARPWAGPLPVELGLDSGIGVVGDGGERYCVQVLVTNLAVDVPDVDAA